MKELLDTKNNWAKFDPNSMTGFLLFKEIASLILDYFSFMNLYQDIHPKSDKYGEKYFFINSAIDIYQSCISGNFINFSICEYY